MQCCLLIVSLTDGTAAKGICVVGEQQTYDKMAHQVNDMLTLQNFYALPGSTAPDSQCRIC